MQQQCPQVASLTTLSGVCRRLKKWRIGQKEGRLHITSPDPLYQEKQEKIQAALVVARQAAAQVSLLFADELTFYRQPCLGKAYHEQGTKQPTAPYTGRANTKRRVVGALDAVTGRVVSATGSVMGVKGLCRFLAQVRQVYGPKRRLMLVWDNWPIHKHPEVEQAAKQHKIELLYTPTYAPWTNPMEKLWRKLKQNVLRLHRLSQEWDALQARVQTFLCEHNKPRPDLLRYVGLQPHGMLLPK